MSNPAMNDWNVYQRRLAAEWKSVQVLADANRLFEAREITPWAEVADDGLSYRMELKFKGKGLAVVGGEPGEMELADEHIVMLEYTKKFPAQPPKIQVVSLLFHPNVSASGLVSSADIGLNWQPDLSSDILCERLWDVIRGAYWDPDQVVNPAAGDWYLANATERLPLDPNPLDDPAEKELNNIIKYRRRDPKAPKHFIAGDLGATSSLRDGHGQSNRDDPGGIHYIE